MKRWAMGTSVKPMSPAAALHRPTAPNVRSGPRIIMTVS